MALYDISFSTPILLEGQCEGWRLKNQHENDPTKAYKVPIKWKIHSDGEGDNIRDIFSIVDGGVTGYEGFYIDCYSVGAKPFEAWWSACAGGSGWDSLRLTKKDIAPIFERWVKERGLRLFSCPSCYYVKELRHCLPWEEGQIILASSNQDCMGVRCRGLSAS